MNRAAEPASRLMFGHAPRPDEAASLALCLHDSPMYFYKKGKGRYKAAPPEALKAALAKARLEAVAGEQGYEVVG